MESVHYKRANELYHLAVDLQGLIIKLCQFLSTRKDVFPEPYIEVLSKLQDNVPPVDYPEIKKILEIYYSEPAKYFKYIDPVPLKIQEI